MYAVGKEMYYMGKVVGVPTCTFAALKGRPHPQPPKGGYNRSGLGNRGAVLRVEMSRLHSFLVSLDMTRNEGREAQSRNLKTNALRYSPL
jgi:hypothetical protein